MTYLLTSVVRRGGLGLWLGQFACPPPPQGPVLWCKSGGDKDCFQLQLVCPGNGCSPDLIATWILLSQTWAAGNRARKVDFLSSYVYPTTLTRSWWEGCEKIDDIDFKSSRLKTCWNRWHERFSDAPLSSAFQCWTFAGQSCVSEIVWHSTNDH